MDTFDYPAIGQRIKLLRKRKRMNQQELANYLGKSLRTVQKYETGEIEVSIAMVNQLADILETTPTYILGYEANTAPFRNLADVVGMLFELERVVGLDFDIDVQRPPRSSDWKCAISINGKKAGAEINTDLCLFLENWEKERDNVRSYYHSQASYQKWKDKTLAYYADTSVECVTPEELDEDERKEKRRTYLNSLYGQKEGD